MIDYKQIIKDEVDASEHLPAAHLALKLLLEKIEYFEEKDGKERTAQEVMCKCGQRTVPAGVDGINWYWQRHARQECTLELPNDRCPCGLLRSEHLLGHRVV